MPNAISAATASLGGTTLERVDADVVWSEAGPLIARALKDSTDAADQVLEQCRDGTAHLLA